MESCAMKTEDNSSSSSSDDSEYVPSESSESSEEEPKKRPVKKRKLMKKIRVIPKFTTLNSSVDSLDKLIKIAEDWLCYKIINSIKLDEITDDNLKYERLSWVILDLIELNNLIGLESLKKSVINQIIFFIQGLQSGELMHTVLYGEQGCGKTTVAKILATMYSKLGILSKGTFRVAQREDFIAGYLGQTATKTKKLLTSCLGGVLFIDEAYSLGPSKKDTDSFSKEAIDTLNQFLSENYEDFICIIAGYEKNLRENFFDKNPGLDRRFPWKFTMNKYSGPELFRIFKYNFREPWTLADETDLEKLFVADNFKNNGGDCKIIFDKAKIIHGRRVFENNSDKLFSITKKDIVMAMDEFLEETRKKPTKEPPFGMYS